MALFCRLVAAAYGLVCTKVCPPLPQTQLAQSFRSTAGPKPQLSGQRGPSPQEHADYRESLDRITTIRFSYQVLPGTCLILLLVFQFLPPLPLCPVPWSLP